METSVWRRRAEKPIRRLMHLYWRFQRPATLGVRALVLDSQSRVFLIRHSYVAGWHLPGGGVETGETLLQALARELQEEGNIALAAAPVLHAVYFNAHVSRRDHVALFVVRDFVASPPVRSREIVDHGFFTRAALPDETTAGTRARIAEVMDGTPAPEFW